MPQFSLKRLLVGMTAVAVGFAGILWVLRTRGIDGRIVAEVWIMSGTILGAGVMAPFKRAGWGALFGFFSSVLSSCRTYLWNLFAGGFRPRKKAA